ncbi:MAG: hydrogenase maturation protease [Aestuariibacter sp.]
MADLELRIICIGNLLHGNDGVGHAVFKRLQSLPFPPTVEMFDGGIGGMTLLPLFKGTRRVLLIDLVKSHTPPGTIVMYQNARNNLPVKSDTAGAHGGDISTLLTMLPIYLSKVPKVALLSVSAQGLKYYNTQLDEPLAAVVDELCRRVKNYVAKYVRQSDYADYPME